MLKFDFSADCSAVAHKAGNFDMFGSNTPVELAGHNIGNFLIDFKIKEEREFPDHFLVTNIARIANAVPWHFLLKGHCEC